MANRRLVALLTDLIFTVKIQDGAKRAGVDVIFVKNLPELLAALDSRISGVVLDLNGSSYDSLAVIKRLKQDATTRSIPLLGYVSHVQTELRSSAKAEGCDLVVARSKFSDKLPNLIQQLIAGEPSESAANPT